ncbi:MAG: DUF2238 domain-containing protein [Phycisphaerales bacterium]|nr:DUF2238 domain-containing protein [Phycisphaerae bacterium]NNF44314.1 DUF2238 domain-containing protein [Phycisphaerales bacterium]NNM27243.1 DUF2238 domain-containing protein [Phycisphaerales bacterium]
MTPRFRTLLPVAVFTGGYMLIALAAALAMRNFEFLFYIATMTLIAGVIALVHDRVGLSRGVTWALALWGLAHMAGGLVPLPAGWPHEPPNAVLYSLWLIPDLLKYDHVVHAYGFGVTTWLCWEGLRAVAGVMKPTLGLLTLAAAAALGFGALNEVIEFAATLLMPDTNVGGYENTGWDLVANLVGAVIGAGLIAATHRRGETRGVGRPGPR